MISHPPRKYSKGHYRVIRSADRVLDAVTVDDICCVDISVNPDWNVSRAFQVTHI